MAQLKMMSVVPRKPGLETKLGAGIVPRAVRFSWFSRIMAWSGSGTTVVVAAVVDMMALVHEDGE